MTSPLEQQENSTDSAQESVTYTRLSQTRDWFAHKAQSAHARFWLGLFAFTESSIFFVPPDPILAILSFLHKERWLYYSLLTSALSLAGAIFGYALGAILFETVGAHIISAYHLEEHVAHAKALIDESVFLFTLTAAFTPIPYKVAVLTAGFAKANFVAFIVASVIGRTARYMLVAYVAKVFGDNAEVLMRRFWFVTTILGALLIAGYIAYLVFAQ